MLKQQGPWTYGALANHLWSFAGSDNLTPAASLSFECSLDGAAFGAGRQGRAGAVQGGDHAGDDVVAP